jgi:hypothetical protein
VTTQLQLIDIIIIIMVQEKKMHAYTKNFATVHEWVEDLNLNVLATHDKSKTHTFLFSYNRIF